MVVDDNLGECSPSWQTSSFLIVNLFGCWFLVILTINIVIEISLTNISINKCVYIPNMYFFLNLLNNFCPFKKISILQLHLGKDQLEQEGTAVNITGGIIQVPLVSHSESFITLFS